jgi:hypothetical protein
MTDIVKKKLIFWIREFYPEKFSDKVRFDWCTNNLSMLESVFIDEKCKDCWNILNWNYTKSQIEYLPCDCYIGELNCLLVVDDFFKFSSFRKMTLDLYENVDTNFDIEYHKILCYENYIQADKFQQHIKRSDFDFEGGANAKRAMLDIMIDLKPIMNKLNPTIRLTTFELKDINSKNELIELIQSRVS